MPEPIPSNVASLLQNQFHQVAIFTANRDESVRKYMDLGYHNWVYDNADLMGVLNGEVTITKARMAFNYDIFPGELEFLEYQGPNRHALEGRDGRTPFISHMSTYVEDVCASSMILYRELGILPYHKFVTANNTNPAVAGKKRFVECIYNYRDTLGYDIKLIEKVPWNYNMDEWIDFDIKDMAEAAQELLDPDSLKAQAEGTPVPEVR